MSDFTEMCEMYGQDPSDPDAIDNMLDMIEEEGDYGQDPSDPGAVDNRLYMIQEEGDMEYEGLFNFDDD